MKVTLMKTVEDVVVPIAKHSGPPLATSTSSDIDLPVQDGLWMTWRFDVLFNSVLVMSG